MAEGNNIGIRKIKQYIEALKDEKSYKKSLLTLVISTDDKISDVTARLEEWITDIKYNHAIEAITFAQQILLEYNEVPGNGLIIYTGVVYVADDIKKDVAIGFEPFKPIYARSNRILDTFDIEALTRLLPKPDCENIGIQLIGIRKIKQYIEALKDEKSNKMSLLSLVISPREEISHVTEKLEEWITDIKYMYAIDAITSAQQILLKYKYRKVPDNGLIIYTGIIYIDDDGKKNVAIEFEPFKRVYWPSNQILDTFDIEALTRLLEPEPSRYNQGRRLLKKDIQSFVVLLVGLVAYLVARSTFKAHDG